MISDHADPAFLFIYAQCGLSVILDPNTITAVFISYGTLGNFFTECNSATRQLGNSGYQKICDIHSMFIKKTHSLRVMPKTILNEHLRWLIVESSLEGLSCRTIGNQLNISKSSVSRTFLHFKKYGCVEELPSLLGRSRILTINDIKYLQTLLKEKLD